MDSLFRRHKYMPWSFFSIRFMLSVEPRLYMPLWVGSSWKQNYQCCQICEHKKRKKERARTRHIFVHLPPCGSSVLSSLLFTVLISNLAVAAYGCICLDLFIPSCFALCNEVNVHNEVNFCHDVIYNWIQQQLSLTLED